VFTASAGEPSASQGLTPSASRRVGKLRANAVILAPYVRFDRLKFDRAIVHFKGERMGQARPVHFVANDRKPSKKCAASQPSHDRDGGVRS
jgi:hypothetical protein